MAAARPQPAARYRAAVSSDRSSRHQPGLDSAPPAPRSAGQALSGSTAEFLSGDWNVVRRISDHRTGQVGSFRGEASFRPYAAGMPGSAVISHDADRDEEPGQPRRVLAYSEHGELQLGSHRGPASRSLLIRDLADGTADVRFADGREFYRLDLRSGTCQAAHPCRADQYLVTVTRLSANSYTEIWRVAGPAKDYELATTYTRAGSDAGTGGQAVTSEAYSGTIPRLLGAAADRDGDGTWIRSDAGSLTFGGAVAAVGLTAEALHDAGVRKGDLVMLTARTTAALPAELACHHGARRHRCRG